LHVGRFRVKVNRPGETHMGNPRKQTNAIKLGRKL
jgi:hypothetical protein